MRILYVAHNPPVPADNGGAQRTNLLLRSLRELGEVDLAIVSTDPVENRDELRRDYNLVADFLWTRAGDRAPFRWFLPLNKQIVHKIAQTIIPRYFDYQPDPAVARGLDELIRTRNYDMVAGRYLRPTLKSGAVGRVPLAVLDVDDLDTQVFLSRLNVPGRPKWERLVNRWHYWQIKKLVPKHLRAFDLLYIPNKEAETAGDELKGLANVVYLPNIPFTKEGEPSQPEVNPVPGNNAPPVVLFVGNFWVLPNQLGVEHFVRHVWPKVHAAEPRAVFRIVGSGLNDEMKRRWGAVPGVEPVGRVPDVRASYDACMFSVVPLLSGAGTNIKIIESLRFNRTCVLTRFASRGYNEILKHDESLLVANDDDAMADACVRLLRDPALRERLAAHGRELVAANYSFERFRDIVVDSINELTHPEPVSVS